MRLQAKEDEVYHLMDLKEWFSVLIGLGSFLEGIALYFFIFRIRAWDQQTNHGIGILLYGTGTR